MSERAYRVSYMTGGGCTYYTSVQFTDCEYQDSWEDAIRAFLTHVRGGHAATIYVYREDKDDYVEVDDEILAKIDGLMWDGLDADEIAQRVSDIAE